MKKLYFMYGCIAWLMLWSICCVFAQKPKTNLTDSLTQRLKTAPADTLRVDMLNTLAWELVTNRPDSTLLLAEEALALAKKLNYQKGLALSYNRIGSAYNMQDQFPKALEYYLQALQAYEKIADKKGQAAAMGNMAIIFKKQGNYEKSLEYNEKSLTIKLEIKDSIGIGASYNNIGTLYKDQGNYEKAIEYQLKSLEIKEKIKDRRGIAYSLNNLGSIYAILGNYEESLSYQLKSLKIKEEIKDRKGIASSLHDISEVYLRQKKYADAAKYAGQALEIGQALKAQETIERTAGVLHEAFKGLGQPAQALAYLELRMITKDSLYSAERNREITKLQSNYEIERRQQEIELLNAQKQLEQDEAALQRIRFYASIGVLVLMLALAAVLLVGYRRSQSANRLLASQKEEIRQTNEELNSTVEELNSVLETVKNQNRLIELKSASITDSIRYARTIQTAILPFEERMTELLGEYFVLYQPKDIVSGDFYWLSSHENKIFLAVADCTGHGVPGAFMSMIGSAIFDAVVDRDGQQDPGAILEAVHQMTRKALKQDNQLNRDGMDAAFCVLSKQPNGTTQVQFAGAKRPLWYVEHASRQLKEVKGTRRAIGGIHIDQQAIPAFVTEQCLLHPGDMLYLMTDGLADQNDENRQKLGSEKLRSKLQKIAELPCDQQHDLLTLMLREHMGQSEQRDDITLLGIRIV